MKILSSIKYNLSKDTDEAIVIYNKFVKENNIDLLHTFREK
jgi:hypothetical protein